MQSHPFSDHFFFLQGRRSPYRTACSTPDRGSQYASDDFRETLKHYGITVSMSRRGNCWGNACSETLFGSLKVERLHGQRFAARRQAKDETLDWLLWYNQSCLHSTLNYLSPMQFEKR
jgi:transposase InsO family protein